MVTITQSKKQKIANFWLISILFIMPFMFIPINGIFSPYIPRFLILIFSTLLFLPFLILNAKLFKPDLQKEPEMRYLLIYYILIFISIFFAIDWQVSLIGSSRLEGFIILSIYLIIFLCAKKIRFLSHNVIVIVLYSAALVCIHAILQKYQLDPIPNEMYGGYPPGLAFSTMGNPNHLGSFIVLLLPFSIYLYLEKKHTPSLAIYGILYYALLSTITRGAWIAALISIIVYLKFKTRLSIDSKYQKQRLIRIGVVTLICSILMILSQNLEIIHRFLSIFFDIGRLIRRDPTVWAAGSNRVMIWGRVIELIKQNPIIGVGIENLGIALDIQYGEYMSQLSGFYQIYESAHNEYLQIAATTGIPSLIIYLGFAYHTLKKSLARIGESDLYLPITASLIGFFTLAMFNNSLIMFEYLLWMLLGTAAAAKTVHYADTRIDLDIELEKGLA